MGALEDEDHTQIHTATVRHKITCHHVAVAN